MDGSPTCAALRKCCAGARSRTACVHWWYPARSRSRRRPRLRASTASSSRPAPRGGHAIAAPVGALVVPGSQQVKKAAEAEGLDRVFIEAGAEWRESGCSMCLGMNGDVVGKGEYSISTSNRNFEGRQGPGARTLLASPLTAAASAVRGRVTDPREILNI